MKKQTSTEATLATIVLAFEIVVVFLTGMTIFGLKLTEPPYLPIIVAGIAIVILIIAMGVMRRGRTGIIIGWIMHVLYFLPMLVLPAVGLVAAIFGALWIYSILKGRQIDRMRRSETN